MSTKPDIFDETLEHWQLGKMAGKPETSVLNED